MIFWTDDFQRIGSWIWKSLLKLRDLARSHLFCNVLSGNQALFWHDNWTPSGPLIMLTGPTGPMVTGISLDSKVFQVVSGFSWHLPRSHHHIVRALKLVLEQVHVPTSEAERDPFLWQNGPLDTPGDFVSSRTWRSMHPDPPHVTWYSFVWFKEKIPKHSFITWLLMRDMLQTKDMMRSWGATIGPECLLCDSGIESVSHLFFEWQYSQAVWQAFFSHRALNPPRMLRHVTNWISLSSFDGKVRTLCRLVFQALVYFIWRKRNARLHSAGQLQPPVLVKQIRLVLRTKMAALDMSTKSNTNRQLQLSSNHLRPRGETFLYTWFNYFG